MPRAILLQLLLSMMLAAGGCGDSGQPSPQQRSSTRTEGIGDDIGARRSALASDAQIKRRDATLNYWRRSGAVIQQVADKHHFDDKAKMSRAEVTAYYKELVSALDQLPILDVDPELVDLVNNRLTSALSDLAAMNDSLAQLDGKTGFGDYAVSEILESLATGAPGTHFRELSAEGNQANARAEALNQRLRDIKADMSKMRATLTQRYGVEL